MSLYDDRYGYPGLFDIDKCTDCGHIYITSKFTDSELVNLYSNYYPRSELDVSEHKSHEVNSNLETWLNGDLRSAYRWVPKNVRVLDIGCGFGESLAYHSSRGCEVYGVEADTNIMRVVEKFGYKVHVGLFEPEMYDTEYFDFITMDQVIEHVVDPIQTLQGIEKILKLDGTVILSVPNPEGWGAKFFGKRWINWHTPYHLHHYTKESMTTAAHKSGFNIVTTKTITSSNWLYFQWKHLIAFPNAGDPSEFWAGKKFKQLSNWKKTQYLFAWVSHKLKINHIITRIFDELGIGDNRLFILQKQVKKSPYNE